MKEFLKSKKRYIIEVVILAALLFVVAKIAKIVMVFPASETYKTVEITASDPKIINPDERSLKRYENLRLLKEGDVLEQYFYAEHDILSGVQLVFIVDGDQTDKYIDLKGDMTISVTDEETGAVLCNIQKSMADILWIDNNILPLDQIQQNVQGRLYKITLTVNHVDERRGVYLDLTAKDIYTEAGMFINGVESTQDMILNQACNKFHFLLSAFRLLILGLTITVYLLYYLLRIRKARLENIYLVLAVFLGIVYMAFLPPYAAPDDQTHINNCYNYANSIMGTPDTGRADSIYMRAEDAWTGLTYEPSLDEYEHIYNSFFAAAKQNTLVEASYNPSLNAAWYAYIPGTLGILLGRLFGLGGIMTLYLGKLLQYAFFVTVVYFIIKMLKHGKMIFLTTALLPMVLQQTTSYSYDVTILAAVFLLAALCLRLTEKEKKLRIPSMIGILLLSLVVIQLKMGAYAPVCLLALLIPVSAFRDKKQKAVFLSIYFVFFAAIFLSGRLGYFKHIFGAQKADAVAAAVYTAPAESDEATEENVTEEISDDTPQRTYENYISWAKSEGYTVGYILQYPGLIPKIIVDTAHAFSSEYAEGMIGNPIGWSNYGWYYPNLLIYGFWLLLILSTMVKLENTSKGLLVMEDTMTWQNRMIVWLAVLGTIGFIIAGMWFSWTPLSFHYIVGVQGRYFLPVLPAALFTLRNKSITTRKNLTPVIITGILLLHLWAFWTIGCCTGMMIGL